MASLTLSGGQGLFTWKITGLGNPFNTTYYMSAGITKTAFTDGATSISAYDTITASSSGSSTTVGPTTVYCNAGTYTIYGWARAANGKYYNSGSGTVTVTGSSTTTYYYRCYDQTNSTWIDSGTSSSSSSITRPSKSGYTYKGYSTGTSYTNALSYGVESTSTTASASSSYPYVCFYYTKNASTTYYYRCYDIVNKVWIDSGTSSSSSSITRPSKSGYTYKGWATGTSYTDARDYGLDSGYEGTGTTASASSSYPYVCFYYEGSTQWALSSQSAGSSISSNYSKTYSSVAEKTLIRTSVSFSKSGTATFYTTGNNDTYGYLSTTTDYDSSTGAPTSHLAYDDDSGDGNNCKITYNVSAGTTYYFWVKQYNGSAISSSMVVHIDPPIPSYKLTISYNGRTLVNALTIDSSSVSLYLGSTNIGTVSSGNTKKLNTKNKFVTSNIKIHNTTLNCVNKFMEDDVTVSVTSG